MNAGRTAPAVTLKARPFDVAKVRADFPILKQTVHGKPLIYLDNAATSQKPRSVIEMVTRYYGKRLTDEQSAFLRKDAKENGGVSGASLKKTLEEAGYFVAVFPGTLDHSVAGLYSHLDLKRPLIVMFGAGPRHYAVVTGYDVESGMLVVLDPARGQVAVPMKNFVKGWQEANYFTLLASLDTDKDGMEASK